MVNSDDASMSNGVSLPSALPPPVGTATNGHSLTSSSSTSNGHHHTSASSNGFHGHDDNRAMEEKRRELDSMQYEGEEGFVPLYEGSNLDRREFVRLALQAFEDMGYRCASSPHSFSGRRKRADEDKRSSSTAKVLQEESGFALEDPAVKQFREGVVSGQWEEVEKFLGVLPIDETEVTVRFPSPFFCSTKETDEGRRGKGRQVRDPTTEVP